MERLVYLCYCTIYYCTVFLDFIKNKNIYNKYGSFSANNYYRKYLIAIFSGVITLSIVAFSSKLQLFFGVLVAIASQLKFQMLAQENN